MDDQFRFRKATLEDTDLLFEWANDHQVRQQAFHSEMISYSVHQKWLRDKLKSKSCCIWVFYANETPVGQLRADLDEYNIAWIDYSIDARYRGKKYGEAMIDRASKLIANTFSTLKGIHAAVKPNNPISQKVFERNGYVQKYVCYSLEQL